MKRVSLLSLTALIWLLGMNAWALEQKDGVYQIGSAEDLASFAQAVSAGETGLNAVLTADIDNYTGPMIGTSTVQYTGIFDGQYHKITLQSEATEDVWALFRTLRGTVKNLHVAGTITTSFKQVGGVAGFIYNAIIENCVSSVDIISSFSGDSGMGGIAASSLEAGNYLTNCIFAGTIQGSAANSCGGIIGWTSKAATLVNCLVVGEITANSKNGDVIARNAKNATRVNCYYVNAYGSIPSDVKQLTAEQLKSGEVAYMLNGNQQNIIWTQTLDKDAYPVPLKNGAQVYAVASGYQCDGTPQGEATYSNTAPGTAFTAHSFTDGVCSVCGSPDPAYMQPNAQGAYEISTAAQLNWFATRVNLGETNLDAVIMQDIDYAGAMIGSPTWRYSGTFDGQFHKINYTTEAAAPIWGLFRVVSGTVKNLFVDGTITTAVNECGGLAGDLYGAAIENVVSTVKIISSFSGDSAHGGLVSRNMKTGSTITNCMFAGSIEGEATNNCAAFIGWTPFVATLTNCLTIGEIKTAVNDGNMIARNPANAKRINCYYMNPYGAIPDDITLITPEQLASGEVCWLLNGDQKTIGWTQTLKEQVAPTPNPSGKQVFASPSELWARRCIRTPTRT